MGPYTSNVVLAELFPHAGLLGLHVTAPLLSESWRNARHLPRGSSRAGDRHLKFYDARDNLFLDALEKKAE
jgi:hypothetical protein